MVYKYVQHVQPLKMSEAIYKTILGTFLEEGTKTRVTMKLESHKPKLKSHKPELESRKLDQIFG